MNLTKYTFTEEEEQVLREESSADSYSVSKADFDALQGNFNQETFEYSLEDSSSLISNIFRGREVVLNEKWDFTETIQGRVANVDDSSVYVDCVIDIENRYFEHRKFPKLLFMNLSNLVSGATVLIKTRIKVGTIKVDVYPGDGIVNSKLFSLEDEWNKFDGGGLDETLEKW